MKDITDYFSSPTKNNSPNDSKTIQNPVNFMPSPVKSQKEESSGKNNKHQKKVSNSPKTVQNSVRQMASPVKSQKQDASKKNKQKKVLLLSTKKSKNTIAISPSNIENDKKLSKGKCKENLKNDPTSTSSSESSQSDKLNSFENLVIDTDTPPLTPSSQNKDSQISNSAVKTKVNAFQFLMESRNNVIGQNTGGKEINDISPSQTEVEREKVSKCKDFLLEWAEKKGRAKRKREEEEVEKCINKKLQKRAKRFKKMLQHESSSSQDFDDSKKNKNSCVIKIESSETEDSKLSVKEENIVNCQKTKNKNGNKTEKLKDRLSIKDNKFSNQLDIEGDNAQDHIIQTKTESKKTEKTKNPRVFHGLLLQIDETKQTSDISKKSMKRKNRLSCRDEFLKDSSKELSNLTPRTHKKWSLKIKLNENMNADVNGLDLGLQNKKSQERGNRVTNKKLVESSLNCKGNKIHKNRSKNHEKLSKVNNVNIVDKPLQKSKKSLEKNVSKSNEKTKNVLQIIVSSDSEEDKPLSDLVKKSAKIAPIFNKAKKIDEKTLEERRIFLMSGVPEKLKKVIEKQRSFEENSDSNVFPSISHVQQKCCHNFWNLPDVNLKLTANDDALQTTNLIYENLIAKDTPLKPLDFFKEVQKVNNLKATLNQIKHDNPDYPVFKAFRHIYEKSGKAKTNTEGVKTSKKRSRKSVRKSNENQKVQDSQKDNAACNKDHEVWIEKYKARCSEEILGNNTGVSKLKKWLETWMNYSEEINSRRKEKTGYDSSSEFDTTDCDSRDSVRLPGNTVIVGGPNGSGKTSAIYAIANELGFNVLEVNASSRRTGKKIQQELQEATQSHQVRKKEIKSIFNIKKSEPPTTNSKKYNENTNDKSEKDNKKMCILLVEDIDIIFDQDDGFFAGLTQLITTSKRPIILTTSDTGPNHIQKLLAQYEYISFTPLSMNTLGVWLQLVCLVEGLFVNQSDLGNLLEYNKGDIRKTLLEVQFWCQSGGQIRAQDKLPILTDNMSKNWEKQLITDEELNIPLSEDCNAKTDIKNFVHKNILSSFEIFSENKEYNIPLHANLGTLWWNTPNILNVRVPQRRFKDKESEINYPNLDKNRLTKVLKYYNALVTTDVLNTSLGHCNSLEPVLHDWTVEVKNSLELKESMVENSSLDFVEEITHFLVNSCVDDFRQAGEFRGINMALPDSAERRWRAKQHICEDFLKEPISLTSSLERRNVTLDYLPHLRSIARTEKVRSTLNTKRGNRFRHYFKNLNMSFRENICGMVCNVLVLDKL